MVPQVSGLNSQTNFVGHVFWFSIFSEVGYAVIFPWGVFPCGLSVILTPPCRGGPDGASNSRFA